MYSLSVAWWDVVPLEFVRIRSYWNEDLHECFEAIGSRPCFQVYLARSFSVKSELSLLRVLLISLELGHRHQILVWSVSGHVEHLYFARWLLLFVLLCYWFLLQNPTLCEGFCHLFECLLELLLSNWVDLIRRK